MIGHSAGVRRRLPAGVLSLRMPLRWRHCEAGCSTPFLKADEACSCRRTRPLRRRTRAVRGRDQCAVTVLCPTRPSPRRSMLRERGSTRGTHPRRGAFLDGGSILRSSSEPCRFSLRRCRSRASRDVDQQRRSHRPSLGASCAGPFGLPTDADAGRWRRRVGGGSRPRPDQLRAAAARQFAVAPTIRHAQEEASDAAFHGRCRPAGAPASGSTSAAVRRRIAVGADLSLRAATVLDRSDPTSEGKRDPERPCEADVGEVLCASWAGRHRRAATSGSTWLVFADSSSLSHEVAACGTRPSRRSLSSPQKLQRAGQPGARHRSGGACAF
jgi:hypothetical protein